MTSHGWLERLVTGGVAVVALGVIAALAVLVPQASAPAGSALDAVPPRTTTLCAVDPADKRSVELVGAGVGEAGSLELQELAGSQQVAQLEAAGVIARTVAAKPYGIVATGDLARSSAAALVSRTATGTDRGLAAQACQLAGTEHWFVGLGAEKIQFSSFLVTNPDAEAAEVEIRVYGPRGAVAAPGSSGLSVPPRGSRTIPLEGMVSGEGPLAVQVRATAGRVGVVAQDRHRRDIEPAGTDWVAPTAAPRTVQVLPGVPGGSGARDLVLANPGERTTTVRVEALGTNGAFVLDGADAVDVPPASTVRVPLAAAAAGDEMGLRISSAAPVAASVVSTSSAPSMAADTATVVATEPLGGRAVVPVAADTDVAGRIVVSNASDTETAATVVVRDRAGAEVAREELQLAPGASAAVATKGQVWAEITTTGTAVHAAVVLTSTRDAVAGLAWLPITTALVAGGLPTVEQDPRVAR